MLYRKEMIHYTRNLLSGMVISLVLVIILFVSLPKISFEKNTVIYFPEERIDLVDVEATTQSETRIPAPPQPKENYTNLEPADDLQLLEDIQIKNNSSTQNAGTDSGTNSGKSNKVYEFSSLPFIPRQVLEVVPENIEKGTRGAIRLSLHIGKDGRVKEHKILFDKVDTDDKDYLKKIIDAAYKSRWQPITIEGDKVEYWIEKTYSFN